MIAIADCGLRIADFKLPGAAPLRFRIGERRFVIRNPQSAIRNCSGRDPQSRPAARAGQRGAILLMVMWVTTALTFIALSFALSARSEMTATRYRVEAEQARFLARGALEQMLYAYRNRGLHDEMGNPVFDPASPELDFRYTTGMAHVRLISESGKMNVNSAPPEMLAALLEVTGEEPAQARETAAAIVDWRTAATSDVGSEFDHYYAALPVPYRAAHGQFQRLEELLLVKGITRELYYGSIERDDTGQLVRRGGLPRVLSLAGSGMQVDANDSPYELFLLVPGLRPDQARAIVAGRASGRYQDIQQLPVKLMPEAQSQITVTSSLQTFAIVATGNLYGSSIRASIRAVFGPERGGVLKLLSWEEHAAGEDFLELPPVPAGG